MAKIESFREHYLQYESWFADNPQIYQTELQAVSQFIPAVGCGLEVGVGSGLFAAPLGIQFGVDPCPEMLARAGQRGINVVLGRSEALPCRSAKFDYILMVTVLCFFDDPVRACLEAKRVLKKNGSLIVAFVDRDSQLGKKYVKNQQNSTFYRNAHFLNTDTVLKLLKKSGCNNFSFRQCLFSADSGDADLSLVTAGSGKGGCDVVV